VGGAHNVLDVCAHQQGGTKLRARRWCPKCVLVNFKESADYLSAISPDF
jgi:hypothetical protein